MSEAKPAEPVSIDLPHFYFNGFQLSLTNSDITGLMLLNGMPTLGISMSYTSAKSLSESLNELINSLEKVTERQIMNSKKVDIGIQRLIESQGKGSKNE